jgi:hypothetical protein
VLFVAAPSALTLNHQIRTRETAEGFAPNTMTKKYSGTEGLRPSNPETSEPSVQFRATLGRKKAPAVTL